MVHGDDVEFEEALPMLSRAAGVGDPGAFSRRRFIQAALVAGGGLLLPAVRPRSAGAAELATPLGAAEGVLVMVFLGGGNDGLNTIAPMSGPVRGRYESLRGGLALPAGSLRPVGGGWGLHPSLVRLHERFGRGRVALVEGTGLPAADLSHFTAMAKVMQGRGEGASGSGWLGRFLDGLPDGSDGMRGLAVASSVPPFLVGDRSQVTSVPSAGNMWGADASQKGEAALLDAVSSFGAGPSGLGVWGDRVGATGRAAVRDAQRLAPVFEVDPGPPGLPRELLLAARLINMDLGARVVGVTFGGWDTHYSQARNHEVQLKALDDAIEVFFANLSGRFRNRVTMLVQSEFGRRPQANGAAGTDHGTAGPMLVIGENVRGGRHGAPPSLDRLDDRGNMTPTVDFRTVYGTLLDRWLDADARQLLGGSFGSLDLFAAGPGQLRP